MIKIKLIIYPDESLQTLNSLVERLGQSGNATAASSFLLFCRRWNDDDDDDESAGMKHLMTKKRLVTNFFLKFVKAMPRDGTVALLKRWERDLRVLLAAKKKDEPLVGGGVMPGIGMRLRR